MAESTDRDLRIKLQRSLVAALEEVERAETCAMALGFREEERRLSVIGAELVRLSGAVRLRVGAAS